MLAPNSTDESLLDLQIGLCRGRFWYTERHIDVVRVPDHCHDELKIFGPEIIENSLNIWSNEAVSGCGFLQ